MNASAPLLRFVSQFRACAMSIVGKEDETIDARQWLEMAEKAMAQHYEALEDGEGWGPAGEWCAEKDPRCGKPDADGIAAFCGRTCWEAAGSPGPTGIPDLGRPPKAKKPRRK